MSELKGENDDLRRAKTAYKIYRATCPASEFKELKQLKTTISAFMKRKNDLQHGTNQILRRP